MEFKLPLLVVEDMTAAREFYVQIMDQEVVMDFGANITLSGGIALQTKDSWAEFIKKEPKSIISDANNFELYFEEECFDERMEKLDKCEIDYVHDTIEYPWGQRVVRIYDPDKNIIEIGESMATVVRRFLESGMTVEEVSARTQHPVEFVEQCRK